MEPNSLGDGLATSPNWRCGHELQFPTWLLATVAAWRRGHSCHYNVHGEAHLPHTVANVVASQCVIFSAPTQTIDCRDAMATRLGDIWMPEVARPVPLATSPWRPSEAEL
ncbi:hypothetical protein B5X24_HaOG201969 [Helicoverpa armigera]|uniref:Uncharacterized protein n=1 Tax=Helicoverpa armigera TaxID=29058 RepID=A0A2W1C0M9_HELAM|nr:hypothetical protein B5X24_HaOG201969 [Helicoverpa armigera]